MLVLIFCGMNINAESNMAYSIFVHFTLSQVILCHCVKSMNTPSLTATYLRGRGNQPNILPTSSDSLKSLDNVMDFIASFDACAG